MPDIQHATTVLLALGLILCQCGRPVPGEPEVPPPRVPTAEVPTAEIPAASFESLRIEGVPHVVQKPLFCGEACAEMWLRKLGRDIDQDQVFARTGGDPGQGHGAGAPGLKRALEDLGFDVGDVWHRFSPADAERELDRLFTDLYSDLQAGVPSIIKMRSDPDNDESEHFRLILGYDAADDEVIYHEPGDANGAYSPIERHKFLDQWPLKYADDEWTVIRLRLQGDTIAAHPPVESPVK